MVATLVSDNEVGLRQLVAWVSQFPDFLVANSATGIILTERDLEIERFRVCSSVALWVLVEIYNEVSTDLSGFGFAFILAIAGDRKSVV